MNKNDEYPFALDQFRSSETDGDNTMHSNGTDDDISLSSSFYEHYANTRTAPANIFNTARSNTTAFVRNQSDRVSFQGLEPLVTSSPVSSLYNRMSWSPFDALKKPSSKSQHTVLQLKTLNPVFTSKSDDLISESSPKDRKELGYVTYDPIEVESRRAESDFIGEKCHDVKFLKNQARTPVATGVISSGRLAEASDAHVGNGNLTEAHHYGSLFTKSQEDASKHKQKLENVYINNSYSEGNHTENVASESQNAEEYFRPKTIPEAQKYNLDLRFKRNIRSPSFQDKTTLAMVEGMQAQEYHCLGKDKNNYIFETVQNDDRLVYDESASVGREKGWLENATIQLDGIQRPSCNGNLFKATNKADRAASFQSPDSPSITAVPDVAENILSSLSQKQVQDEACRMNDCEVDSKTLTSRIFDLKKKLKDLERLVARTESLDTVGNETVFRGLNADVDEIDDDLDHLKARLSSLDYKEISQEQLFLEKIINHLVTNSRTDVPLDLVENLGYAARWIFEIREFSQVITIEDFYSLSRIWQKEFQKKTMQLSEYLINITFAFYKWSNNVQDSESPSMTRISTEKGTAAPGFYKTTSLGKNSYQRPTKESNTIDSTRSNNRRYDLRCHGTDSRRKIHMMHNSLSDGEFIRSDHINSSDDYSQLDEKYAIRSMRTETERPDATRPTFSIQNKSPNSSIHTKRDFKTKHLSPATSLKKTLRRKCGHQNDYSDSESLSLHNRIGNWLLQSPGLNRSSSLPSRSKIRQLFKNNSHDELVNK